MYGEAADYVRERSGQGLLRGRMASRTSDREPRHYAQPLFSGTPLIPDRRCGHDRRWISRAHLISPRTPVVPPRRGCGVLDAREHPGSERPLTHKRVVTVGETLEKERTQPEVLMRRPGLEPGFRRWQRLVITTTLSAHACALHCVPYNMGFPEY